MSAEGTGMSSSAAVHSAVVETSSSTTTSSKETTITPWLRRFLIFVLVPFIIGYGISMGTIRNFQTTDSIGSNSNSDTTTNAVFDISMTNFLSTVSLQTQRMLSFYNRNAPFSLSSSSSGVFVPNMDVHKCFVHLERQMFEGKPLWEALDSTTIFIHRNGQAEACGNSSSSSTAHQSSIMSNHSGGKNINGTNASSSLITSSSNLKMIFRTALQELYELGQSCPNFGDKYHVESLVTRVLVHLITWSACPSDDSDGGRMNNKNRNTHHLGLYDYCDMGEDRTPILLDHKKLIPNTIVGQQAGQPTKYTLLPCHFHTEHGLRVTSLLQLTRLLLSSSSQQSSSTSTSIESGKAELSDDSRNTNCYVAPDGEESCDTGSDSDVPTTNSHDTDSGGKNTEKSPRGLHLYAVPAGRVFMHVAAYIGQTIALDHVKGADPNQPVYLKVLSTSPAVFDLYNFFTKEESAELVERALAETKESHRIKRSTTGTGEHHVNARRTSENGFDTDGATSILIKKRCFQVLGFDEYIESHGDGLQILRYNQTTAYIPHMDYLDIDKRLEHDYDSSKKGGNRFATILLYMTDLGEKDGGETVFIDAWPTGQSEEDHKPIETALRELRESDQHGILEEGSWQEKMVAQCRSRLAIRPNSARAVLFYSQLPNGEADPKSKHGGCPVLSGVKYAANLWVWNTPRDGYAGNPKNPDFKSDKNVKKKNGSTEEDIPPGRVTATFRNSGKDARLVNAKLYFYDGSIDKEWGALGFGEKISIFTYKTHVWKVMVGGEVFHTFTIDKDQPAEQEFVV